MTNSQGGLTQITSALYQSELISEARVSLKLAVPLVLSQMCETGMNTVNVVMMGLLGTQVLAGGALGAIAFLTLLFTCYGILSAGGALAAEAFGANKIDRVSRIACQEIWLAAAMSLPAMVLLWQCDSILLLLGQQQSNVLLTKIYLRSIILGFPAALGILVLKDIASAVNVPRLITVIMVAGLILNAPADYVLMFGKFGFPSLGLAGIGWGSALVFWVIFIAGAVVLSFHPKVRDYKLFRYLHKFDRETFVKIFQTGWPIGLQWAAETALLNVTAWLAGYLGTVTLAAHEIAIQTAEIAMVRLVSEWAGLNVLMLDEERIIVEKNQEPMIKALKDWGFKPIVCSFENYYPFLGSFHCATLDVRRQGTLQSYF